MIPTLRPNNITLYESGRVSTDIIDSIDSILVPHNEAANIYTTRKGACALRARKQKYTKAALPHYFCFLFVCGVNAGCLFVWHKYRIYRIYNISRICRFSIK